jgi:predicted amidohydrolase
LQIGLPGTLTSFEIAVAQINTKLGDVKSNLSLIREISSKIKKKKKEIEFVCFPELATTGYALGRRWIDLADEIPGYGSDEIAKIAIENGFYLICGVDERGTGIESDKIFDSAVLFDPNGKIMGVYRKVHLWGQERKFFTSGDKFPVFKTKFGNIGIGICYDLEFPESSRVMARKGAKLIFFPSAQPSTAEKQIEIYVRSRSSENCVFTAFSNRIGKEPGLTFFGKSQINSPDAKILALANRNEIFASATIDYGILNRQAELLPYLRELEPKAYVV